MKKIISILICIGILYIIDPAFEREVTFDKYVTTYEWRIFNNFYCNFKTKGHCHTNETNKTNAEIELYQLLVENYNGEKNIEQKLKKVVNEIDRFNITYSELTKVKNVEIDSLKKYKNLVFRKIMLK